MALTAVATAGKVKAECWGVKSCKVLSPRQTNAGLAAQPNTDDTTNNTRIMTSGSEKPPALRHNAMKSVRDQGTSSIATVGLSATFGEPGLKTLKAIGQLRMMVTATLHPWHDNAM